MKATRDASHVGLVIGVALIGYGVYTVLTGGLLGGLWLAFIGWILAFDDHAVILSPPELRERLLARVGAA